MTSVRHAIRRTAGIDRGEIVKSHKTVLLAAVGLYALTGLSSAQQPVTNGVVNGTYAANGAEPVIYSAKDAIAASFEKNNLMLHDSHGSYMVETAQRMVAGGAEVHLMDTDVTYVIKGSATIITGGTVVDVNPHPTSRPSNPHPEYEIRGARIVGGQAFHLSAGDSIVIPKGVPHQYSEVQGPFWYFNVKVR
jgi:mannose-6-phosphate isomerase-like protein (cupin superfamily)